MAARLIASICAVLWAYAAVAAVLTHELSLVGPCAAGFVVCLFCAQLLQPRAPFDQEEVDVSHDDKPPFFCPTEPHNSSQPSCGPL